jgi:arylsulfatase A-like enzyme
LPNSTARSRPNVLLIVMDDLAFGDLACHGNPHVRTPHLDRMHADSTRLTRYQSGPVCTPARACLMTGRYAYRTRAFDTYCGRSMMEPDEVTLAELLGGAGYRTGIFGKWHLGDSYPTRAIDQGFEEAVVHNGGGLRQPANIGRDAYHDPQLMHNGELEQYHGYCTDIYADCAMDWIERQRDEPWVCYLATNAPHSPFEIGEKWVEPYREQGLNETFARIYGMVENIDHNVGRVFAQLDRLGLAEDTLVIYTSDHGPCGSARHEGETRFNAGLRNIKGTVYQGGVKVPCFWRWPGKLAAGQDVRHVANPVDVLPTVAAACGVDPPSDRTIDGIDLLPALTGEQPPASWPERETFLQWHRGDTAVRYRNYAVIDQRYKLTRPREDAPDELYDLDEDPGEQRDLAAEMPDRVTAMRKQYDAWFDDVSATRPDNYDPPRIRVGTDHENPVVLNRNDWRIKGDVDQCEQPEHEGLWLVDLEAGVYDVTIDLPRRLGQAEVTLRIGEQQWQTTILPDLAYASFESLEMAAGDTQVDGWITADGQRYGPQHIRIHRRG